MLSRSNHQRRDDAPVGAVDNPPRAIEVGNQTAIVLLVHLHRLGKSHRVPLIETFC